MAKLPFDFYLTETHEPAGVFTWGKAPESTEKDLAAVVARLGGFRTPNYGQAYLVAANTLLRTAIADRTLDHHGLPIFFLQRHAAELIIKAPLQLGLAVQKYREDLGRPRPNFPVDADQRKRADSSHDLVALLADLEEMARVLGVGVVPDALRSAAAAIEAVEGQHTWSRYSFRRDRTSNGPQLVNHMDQEVVVPLGDIQNSLQAANDAVGSIYPFGGSIMGNLGALWESLARQAGEFD
ncbi:hypothetical protein ACSFBM_28420 [Variovorax sp. GB1R11]|uniref:hypothetical protein n=1 Tax=Variovorax sp. GB1R11 TaxID=3443741 RepID=UPI003F44AD06